MDPSSHRPAQRTSWDEYFLDLAAAASTRATCLRSRHGAVIVQDRRVVSTGYDGSPSGYPHCGQGTCPMPGLEAIDAADGQGCTAIHAAANALLFAAPRDRQGATLYCTGAPCFACAKLIANSGLAEVVASAGRYEGWETVRDFLRDCSVRVRLLDGFEGVPSLRFA